MRWYTVIMNDEDGENPFVRIVEAENAVDAIERVHRGEEYDDGPDYHRDNIEVMWIFEGAVTSVNATDKELLKNNTRHNYGMRLCDMTVHPSSPVA
jgi:hypothetical protein